MQNLRKYGSYKLQIAFPDIEKISGKLSKIPLDSYLISRKTEIFA